MIIEGTRSTPSVTINEGVIEIKGRSIPEDAFEFYSPILNEITSIILNSQVETKVQLHLEYINSGSKKFISNILGQMDELYTKGHDLVIYWHYDHDDDSMQELGNDFRSMVQIPFHLVEIK